MAYVRPDSEADGGGSVQRPANLERLQTSGPAGGPNLGRHPRLLGLVVGGGHVHFHGPDAESLAGLQGGQFRDERGANIGLAPPLCELNV